MEQAVYTKTLEGIIYLFTKRARKWCFVCLSTFNCFVFLLLLPPPSSIRLIILSLIVIPYTAGFFKCYILVCLDKKCALQFVKYMKKVLFKESRSVIMDLLPQQTGLTHICVYFSVIIIDASKVVLPLRGTGLYLHKPGSACKQRFFIFLSTAHN